MSEASEQILEAQIEHMYQEFRSQCATLLVPPGENGYSSQVLTSYVALLIECEDRLAALAPIARKFDSDKPGAASKRLSELGVALRRALKEGCHMAPFKAVREEFVAYLAALPAALPPNAPPPALAACLNRFVEFEQRFLSFEPHATALEAEGQPALRQWLTPAVEAARLQIAAIRKRLLDSQRNAVQLGSQESQKLAELTTICNELDAAENLINSEIEARRRNMGIRADTSPCNKLIYGHYQRFLNRISQLEPAAKELADQGRPQLMQSVQAKKTDVENAGAILLQIIAGRQAADRTILKNTADANEDILGTMERMHQKQVSMTEAINKRK